VIAHRRLSYKTGRAAISRWDLKSYFGSFPDGLAAWDRHLFHLGDKDPGPIGRKMSWRPYQLFILPFGKSTAINRVANYEFLTLFFKAGGNLPAHRPRIRPYNDSSRLAIKHG
jgi:hypothetical protein